MCVVYHCVLLYIYFRWCISLIASFHSTINHIFSTHQYSCITLLIIDTSVCVFFLFYFSCRSQVSLLQRPQSSSWLWHQNWTGVYVIYFCTIDYFPLDVFFYFIWNLIVPTLHKINTLNSLTMHGIYYLMKVESFSWKLPPSLSLSFLLIDTLPHITCLCNCTLLFLPLHFAFTGKLITRLLFSLKSLQAEFTDLNVVSNSETGVNCGVFVYDKTGNRTVRFVQFFLPFPVKLSHMTDLTCWVKITVTRDTFQYFLSPCICSSSIYPVNLLLSTATSRFSFSWTNTSTSKRGSDVEQMFPFPLNFDSFFIRLFTVKVTWKVFFFSSFCIYFRFTVPFTLNSSSGKCDWWSLVELMKLSFFFLLSLLILMPLEQSHSVSLSLVFTRLCSLLWYTWKNCTQMTLSVWHSYRWRCKVI